MKLNLSIIADELADLRFCSGNLPAVTTMNCPLPRLYEPGDKMQEGCCYVCRIGDIPPNVPADVSVIAIGGKPAQVHDKVWSIWTVEDVSATSVLNRVLGVFEHYEAWTGELEQIVSGSGSAASFGAVLQRVLGNPTMCFSSAYRCVFHVPGDLAGVSEKVRENYVQLFEGDVPYPEGKTLDLSSIGIVSQDERFTSALSSRTPVKTGHNLLLFDSASQTVYVDGQPSAWLIVNGLTHPICKRDEAVLYIAARYMSRFLKKHGVDNVGDTTKAGFLLSEMVRSSESVDRHRVVEAIGPLGWDTHDEYLCILIDVASRNPVPDMLRSVARIINHHIPSSIATVMGHNVLVVANLSQSGLSVDEFVGQFTRSMKDSIDSASMSRVFEDFRDMRFYSRQCELIANLPSRDESLVKRYDDYALDIDLDAVKSSGLPIESLYPEGLRALKRHDHSKGSRLVELLRVYLACECSVVKTTRQANISKSTCVYRLNRIKEISHLDLDDYRVRLELQIVLELERLES